MKSKDNVGLAASLAVFAEVHNSGTNLPEIIGGFVLATYALEAKNMMNASEAKIALKSHFDFDLPESVVSTSMRKLSKSGNLKGVNGNYTAINQSNGADSFQKRISEKEQATRLIENALIQFVENEIKKKLSNLERGELIESLIKFVVGGKQQGRFVQEINSFIVKNANKPAITRQLSYFREGAVLLSGLRHTNDLAEISAWNDELVVLLDMEILFHAAGYNGILFKQLFDDFYHQVQTINNVSQKRRSKKLIHLKFLRSVEESVKNYFGAAMDIVSTRKSFSPEREAMRHICNGSKTPVDVVRKKAEFEQLLKSLDIHAIDDLSYYSNYEYVIDDNQLFEQLKKKYGAEDVEEAFVAFTKVNAFRKGNHNRKLEKSGYIIVSGKYSLNGISFELSKDPAENYTPFCTDLDYITNRFWFKTNLGMSNSGTIPRSMDVLAKAQMALSSQLSRAIASKYQLMKQELDEGTLSEEVAVKMLVDLRSSYKKPEEITSETVDSSIQFLNEDSIEKHSRELTLLKEKAERGALAEGKLREIEQNDHRKQLSSINRKVKTQTRILWVAFLTVAIALITLSIWIILALKQPSDTPLSILAIVISLIVEIPTLIWCGKKVDRRIKNYGESYQEKLLKKNKVAM